MQCSFCRRHVRYSESHALCICPHCLSQLLSVAPDDLRYNWFVSAMRRSLQTAALLDKSMAEQPH